MSGSAYKNSVTQRLAQRARVLGLDPNVLLKRFAFQRILARLALDERWVLKGGFVMELRLGLAARTTKDLDLVLRDEGTRWTPQTVQDLIDEFGELPGIGPKSAQRMAFHILAADSSSVDRLIEALRAVKARVRFCETCGNIAESEQCAICKDPRRDQRVICVVEEPKDVVAIERTREYRGLYHVLGGAIDPINGVGPDDLRVRELFARLSGEVSEVILATDPDVVGEATAAYLTRMLRTMDVPVSRLASGLPVGSDLEYADEVTLGRAFEGRRRVEN